MTTAAICATRVVACRPLLCRARYYNPAVGRFLSEDPMGFAGSGPNLYEWAGDDPVDFLDPFGLDKKAPNNNRSGYESLFCLGDALKSSGAKLGLDAAGIGVALLSGGSTNVGAVKFFATAGVGAVSTAYRAATSGSFSGGAGNFARGTGGTFALTLAALQELVRLRDLSKSFRTLAMLHWLGTPSRT